MPFQGLEQTTSSTGGFDCRRIGKMPPVELGGNKNFSKRKNLLCFVRCGNRTKHRRFVKWRTRIIKATSRNDMKSPRHRSGRIRNLLTKAKLELENYIIATDAWTSASRKKRLDAFEIIWTSSKVRKMPFLRNMQSPFLSFCTVIELFQLSLKQKI